jgi:AcrR family transcriptional regulator
MAKVVPAYKEDAKQRIIQAAMEAIAERGYAQTTIDDVAKTTIFVAPTRLGVSKGAVYWYFSSKEDLLQEVFATILAEMQRVAYDGYNRPFEEVLTLIFERYSLSDKKRRALICEMFALASRSTPRIGHIAIEYINSMVSLAEEGIIRGQQKGTVTTEINAHTLALLIVALYSGLQDYALTYMTLAEMRQLWQDAMRLLLKPADSGEPGGNKL